MIATKKLTSGDACRLLNSVPQFPNATSLNRVKGWMKRNDVTDVDIGRITKHYFNEWRDADLKGPSNRSERESKRAAEKRLVRREIGELPKVADAKLRAACDADLFHFGTTCFPELFYLEHSPDHLTLAKAIQTTIEKGGKQAIACQRGMGKTVWCVLGVMWAALTGRVPMIMLISGNDTEANNIASGIVTELETNKKLAEVYPEICHAYRFAADLGATAKPLYKGKSIRMKCKPDIVFPALPGVAGSECCIRVTGIDSRRVRGAHHKTTTGKHVRPGVALLDDPQDDDFARRPTDVAKREKKIKKAIHGLSGPGRQVAVLMPCTVIEVDDLADRFLNQNRSPEYRGIRFPALDSFPSCFDDPDSDLWQQYFELLATDLLSGDEEHTSATAFYVANLEAMKLGAVVRWEARIEGDCIDALQTLMNKYANGRAAFMSEYQQDPEDDQATSSYLDETQLSERFNGLKRRIAPAATSVAVAGMDVQQRLLYWMVTVWSDDLKGYIVDYGTFPKQRTPQFTHLNAPFTLEDYVRKKFPLQRYKWEDALKIAIRDCIEQNIRPAITRPGAEPLAVENCHIDNQWVKSREPIDEVAAEDELKDILQPDGGMFLGGNDVPISQRKMPKGSRRVSPDVQWYFKRVPYGPDKVIHDANFYRSQLQQGLATATGAPGAVTFFGTRPDAELANHLSAKFVKVDEGKKQTAEVWKNKIGRDQDHWLDCGVMCRVGVEVLGFRSTGRKSKNAKKAGATRKKLDPAKIKAARDRARRN